MQADRRKKLNEGTPEQIVMLETLDCTACQEMRPERDRAELRCGWMPPSERVDAELCGHGEDVCPGYAIQLPEVMEAAQAYAWREKGSLDALYGDCYPLPQAAIAAVDLLAGAVSDVQSDELKPKPGGSRGP